MKEGQIVRLIQPVIQGEIKDTRYNKDAQSLEHLVAFTGDDGESHERWFIESSLEVIENGAQ